MVVGSRWPREQVLAWGMNTQEKMPGPGSGLREHRALLGVSVLVGQPLAHRAGGVPVLGKGTEVQEVLQKMSYFLVYRTCTVEQAREEGWISFCSVF